ncbi:MAG: phosphodiester glycosidase family protein [Clostridia bacterium]|nr:phosphodiester glycosidase family protein [Clostridia bacterium]
MKKKIIAIAIFAAILVLSSCLKVDFNLLQTEFDNLLKSGSYETANTLYTAAEDERIDYYNTSLELFSESLMQEALNDMPIEEAKSSLEDFLIFDYTKPAVQAALDELAAKEQAIIQSNTDYAEGLGLYLSRRFDESLEKLSAVQDYDVNYDSALEMIAELESRAAMWENAAAENLSGRNTSVNSLAYSDGYVYFPAKSDGVYSIVKYNYETGETSLFPIIEFIGTFHIKGINVIGDYIYFIAGEELGRGLMLNSPYNIYEMKTDGTGLAMVKSGDYFDLISYGDTFYALSYSKGIVKMDQNLQNEEIISDKWIIEMQATVDGLYYIEKLENECDSIHILYLYKDGVSTEVMREEMLHAYFFDTFSIYYHDMGENNYEEIYVADASLQNAERIATLKDSNNGDMYGFIGAIGDKVMFNAAGWLKTTASSASMRQSIYSEIQISRKLVERFQDPMYVPDYEAINVLYEEGMILVKSSDGSYSLTATPGNNNYDRIVSIPDFDSNILNTNMSIISEYRPGESDFYSDEEVVVELDSFWYYSSPNLNVTIEKIYDESIETLIFVTHIRTKDSSGFSLGYSNLEEPGVYTIGVKTDTIAQINKAVFATNGDFGLNAENNWIGKVIRNGRIFDAYYNDGGRISLKEFTVEEVYDTPSNCKDFLAMYPDGTMAVYSNADKITYGELIDAGVENTISFGPILVRDGEKAEACVDPSYYISGANPRCAWGMVEPGHYVNVVAEGRQPSVSRGMSFYTMGTYFQQLGCSVAYNLDGGQTAAIAFMGRFLNTHQNDVMFQNHRPVQEIIYFGTSDLVPYDLENYYER